MGAQHTAADLLSQSVDQKTALGDIHITQDGNIYQYAKAEGAITAGHMVYIDEVGDAYPATTTNVGSTYKNIGFAGCDVTDEYYAWFWRGAVGSGTFEAIVTNGVAANTNLTTTASAGLPGTGGTAVVGLRSIDAGVTSTRVTVQAAGILRT